MTKLTPPAIILGGGRSNGLGIARNLGHAGIPIYCLASNAQELTFFSKYCTGFANVPRIERDVHVLQWSLEQLRPHITAPGVIFPTSDTAVLTLSQLLDDLDGFMTTLPPRHLIETMVFKNQFYASLRQWKIPHPQTWDLDSDTWSQDIKQLPFPVYLRPVQSLPFAETFRRKGFLAYTRHDVDTYLNLARSAGHSMILQEIIPGSTINEYILRGFLDKQSQPTILVANQRIRRLGLLPPNAVKKSIPLAHIGEFTADIVSYLQKIKYTGLFTAEFKRDPRDGVLKLFEINARSGGSNYLVYACGANHILAAYRDALGENSQVATEYQPNVYQIELKVDLYQHIWRLLHGQSIRTFWTPYIGKKCWLIFSREDPLPFMVDLFPFFRS